MPPRDTMPNKESDMVTTRVVLTRYCENCGVELLPDEQNVCQWCWDQMRDDDDRDRPEFPVYYDAQGNEHAEF